MSASDNIPWQQMTPGQRALAYSPSEALPDRNLTPFIKAYTDQSRAAYGALAQVRTLAYGTKPSQTLDLVLPATPESVPLLVFIHGGYWQELSKQDSFFPAPDAVARGVGYAAIDYSLAPAATLTEIVAECGAALELLFKTSGSLGIDPTRIVIAGSSAGAHLAAMTCLHLAPEYRPRAAVLLSGIYELEPLIGTYVNDALGLNRDGARANSPLLKDLTGFPDTIVTWGEVETDEFKRQSRRFASALAGAGCKVDSFEMRGRNHFDIVFDLINDSMLGQATAAALRAR